MKTGAHCGTEPSSVSSMPSMCLVSSSMRRVSSSSPLHFQETTSWCVARMRLFMAGSDEGVGAARRGVGMQAGRDCARELVREEGLGQETVIGRFLEFRTD